MSIESEINRINTNVQNTLAAIEELGGEVPEGANSDQMVGAVRTIPVGANIDDTTPSTETTYSSAKIEAELSKQKEAIDKKVGTDQLNTAVNNALTEAKNSGEFNGPTGPQGPAGNDGETPEKGVDYWTEADKAEIVSDVLAALPNASGVSF